MVKAAACTTITSEIGCCSISHPLHVSRLFLLIGRLKSPLVIRSLTPILWIMTTWPAAILTETAFTITYKHPMFRSPKLNYGVSHWTATQVLWW